MINTPNAVTSVLQYQQRPTPTSKKSALESEGYAVGTQNGEPVSSDSPYYHNNSKYYSENPQLREGQVETDNIADGAVTTPKIADGAVTTPKIADGTISKAKFDSALTSEINGVESAVSTLQTQIGSPFNYKGSVAAVANLPDSGNTINDTYYVEAEYCLYSWNGTAWSQSSLDESDYLDEISELKSAFNVTSNTIGDELYTFSAVTKNSTVDNYTLNEANGLAVYNASYQLDRYAVTAGKTVKIVCNHKFQFNIGWETPVSGDSNRVGVTYGAGQYIIEVPATATTVIISTPEGGSSAVYVVDSKTLDELSADIEATAAKVDTNKKNAGNH